MTTEQKYYENEAFSADEFFPSHTDRFEGIANLIPQAARSVLDVGSGNDADVRLTSLLERRARGNGEENHFPVAVPCPVCGQVLPPAKGGSAPKPQGEALAHNAAASSPRRGGPLGLVKSLLPSETRYGHVAALYERA